MPTIQGDEGGERGGAVESERETWAHKLEPGFVLEGRFEILGLLGAGGFARVYRARQLRLGQEVALKVLLKHLDGPLSQSFHERFEREARTVAQLQHPGIVRVMDYGFVPDGRPYIAMELLQGRSLEELLEQEGALEPGRALHLMVQCLDALQVAHVLGVVHRDLKPSNLFLVHEGSRAEALKVLDFGIALLDREDDRRLTATGQFIGSPQYSPREYIEQQLATPAMDVYQMALILVEMMTGQPVVPYVNMFQCFQVHCQGPLELPAWLMESALGPVLGAALAQEPSLRPRDAAALRDALEEVASQIGALERPRADVTPLVGAQAVLQGPGSTPAAPGARGNLPLAGLLAALVLLLLALSSGLAWILWSGAPSTIPEPASAVVPTREQEAATQEARAVDLEGASEGPSKVEVPSKVPSEVEELSPREEALVAQPLEALAPSQEEPARLQGRAQPQAAPREATGERGRGKPAPVESGQERVEEAPEEALPFFEGPRGVKQEAPGLLLPPR